MRKTLWWAIKFFLLAPIVYLIKGLGMLIIVAAEGPDEPGDLKWYHWTEQSRVSKYTLVYKTWWHQLLEYTPIKFVIEEEA